MMMFVVGGNGLTVAEVSHTWQLNHKIIFFLQADLCSQWSYVLHLCLGSFYRNCRFIRGRDQTKTPGNQKGRLKKKQTKYIYMYNIVYKHILCNYICLVTSQKFYILFMYTKNQHLLANIFQNSKCEYASSWHIFVNSTSLPIIWVTCSVLLIMYKERINIFGNFSCWIIVIFFPQCL